MADLVACVEIARKLEEARATARAIAGPRYEEQLKPWRELVLNLSSQWKCRPIEVPPRLERDCAMPANPLWLLAAVVELIEEQRA